MGGDVYVRSYSVVGDISTIVIGILLFVIMKNSVSLRDKRQKYINWADGMVIAACLIRMCFYRIFAENAYENRYIIYCSRLLFYSLLSIVLVIFLLYIMELVGTGRGYRKIYISAAGVGFILFLVAMQILSHLGIEFRIDSNGIMFSNTNLEAFHYYYIFMILLITGAVIGCKRYLVTKVRRCIIISAVISVGIVVVQAVFDNLSMLCLTFMLPMIPICCIFHNQGHDMITGALDYRAFMTFFSNSKKEDLCFINLYLAELTPDKVDYLREHFYHFNEAFFKGSTIFQLDDQHFVMGCKKKQNPKFVETMPKLIDAFYELYKVFKIDYKIVWFELNGEIESGQEYYKFVEYMESQMDTNEVDIAKERDYREFEKKEYIVQELTDINKKGDLNDPRVKVFCQPVWNTKLKKYTTAEALMRFETEEYGMIFPDVFIPIAENNGMIHTLSKIILNKTCLFIRSILDAGEDIERISVNFSIEELRDETFCKDIIEIIQGAAIPFDKIAIELTESKNEKDFQKMKSMMTELQQYGIKFYLDDFGTGYSNVERIIGLPIDIIKFDRSLTILARKDDMSRNIVSSFSDIFEMAKYQILFEGVEDEIDEEICMNMHAEYLQGYKYSRPIPIEELEKFIS